MQNRGPPTLLCLLPRFISAAEASVMTLRYWFVYRFAVCFGLCAPVLAQTQFPQPPDKIFVGGTVITMLREGDMAEAVAVRNGRITAVGRNADVRSLAGPATKVVDLAGKALLPGFYAAHDHFPSSGRVAL